MKNQTSNVNKKQILLIIAAILLVVVLLVVFGTSKNNQDGEITSIETTETGEKNDPVFTLDYDLAIMKIGTYSGAYMEDASDEKVEDVLAIVVKNNADKPLQYAEITLTSDSGDALFKLSTLNPGQSVLVLEANRKVHSKGDSYTGANAQNVAFFDGELTSYEEQLKIQPLEGGFNITNISEEDITGEIMVYFKDCKENQLYGGITFRGRIEGGLKAGEIRQIMTDNFTENNTKVMFVTITETE